MMRILKQYVDEDVRCTLFIALQSNRFTRIAVYYVYDLTTRQREVVDTLVLAPALGVVCGRDFISFQVFVVDRRVRFVEGRFDLEKK